MPTVFQCISTFHFTRTDTRAPLNIIRSTLRDTDITALGVCHWRLQLTYQEGTRKLLLPIFPQSNVSGVQSNSEYGAFPKLGIPVGWSPLRSVLFTLPTFLLCERLGLCPALTFSVKTEHRANSVVNRGVFISY